MRTLFKPSLRFRSQLLIDPRVQIPILQRTAFYTTVAAIYFMVVLFYSESTEFGHESFTHTAWQCLDVIACWAPGLMLIVPIIIYDVLVFSNRFAGPMYRLRQEMQRLIDDQSDRPMQLRDGDFWPEIADLYNQLRDQMIELRAAQGPSGGSLFQTTSTDSEDPIDSIPPSTADQPQPVA